MNRRFFIHSGIFSSFGLSLNITSTSGKSIDTSPNEDVINKVREAMLTMQRASWEQGVAAQSLMESGKHELAYLMAKEAVLRQTVNGRLAVLYTDNGVTDPAANGPVVKKMGEKFGDTSLVNAAQEMLAYLLNEAPRNEDGTFYHILSAPELWIDSMYMAPPFLAVMGEYLQAVNQIFGLKKYLWNEEVNLYSHRWSDETSDFPNKSFWGVGNGWAAMGISRVLVELPEEYAPERERLKNHYSNLLDGMLKYIRDDGLFHNVIDDPSTFVETNLSQMLAYSIYRNVHAGWLDKSYVKEADKMRLAAHKKVDAYGYVQDVCGAPFFNAPGRATEGQAGYLLMEAAFKDYAG